MMRMKGGTTFETPTGRFGEVQRAQSMGSCTRVSLALVVRCAEHAYNNSAP